MIFHILTVLSLTESGYLYSVGRKKFLSLDMDHIRLVPKHQMPEPFEIEQRGGNDSYRLKIKPSPNQEDKVIDKDWWTNSHRLILHKPTEWESEKFTFALLPKNMIKIVVKGSCILAEDSGYVRATDCTDDDNQMYRWIPSKEEAIVEEFVERHGGTVYKKKRDVNHSHEDHHKRRNYDEDSDFINPHKIRPSESGRRPEEDSEFISPRRNKKKRYFVEDSDLHERRRRPSHKYDDYDEPRHRPKFDRDYDDEPRHRPSFDDEPRRRPSFDDVPRRRPIYDDEPRPNHNYEESDELDDIYYKYKGGRINDPINKRPDSYKKQDSFRNKRYEDDACLNNSCDSSNRKKLNCDEVVDSIEKVICDIDGLPDFI